jgi:hypothetical protein
MLEARKTENTIPSHNAERCIRLLIPQKINRIILIGRDELGDILKVSVESGIQQISVKEKKCKIEKKERKIRGASPRGI